MNYIETRKLLPSRYRHFVFIDDRNCSANHVFLKHELNAKIRDVAICEQEKYQIVFCDVEKKDVLKFQKAMESLRDNMLILGNKDYDDWCENMFKYLEG